jgi:hypothetical protein
VFNNGRRELVVMNLLVVSFVWNICIGVRIARDSTFRRIDIMMRELMGWRSLVGRGLVRCLYYDDLCSFADAFPIREKGRNPHFGNYFLDHFASIC